MSDDVLVQVEGVSKKFCRSLKRSLWYGVQDVSAEMIGRKGSHDELRKNEFWAVNDVSFELRRGECLGLIGPNGAGKSTLLKMLNGLVKPDKGRITMRGRVGALIELGAGFNPILTARENIYVNGSVLGFSKKEIDHKFDAIVDFAEIEEFIDTSVQNFSSGMKVRLGFAVAAQMEPDVLLIDEVLAVGDARFSAKCINQLSSISKNSSLIVVSHSMPLISRISNRGMSIINGQLSCFSGEINSVIEDYLSSVSFSDFCNKVSQGVSVDQLEINGQIIPSSSEIVTVEATEPLEIKIAMKSQGIEHPLFANIVFLDLEGKPVAQCLSSNSSFYLDSNRRQEFKLVLNSIPLNPGRYFVQLVFVEALGRSMFGKILYQNLNEASIAVRGGKLSYAPVQFRGAWTSC